jgi:hypothetical protein
MWTATARTATQTQRRRHCLRDGRWCVPPPVVFAPLSVLSAPHARCVCPEQSLEGGVERSAQHGLLMTLPCAPARPASRVSAPTFGLETDSLRPLQALIPPTTHHTSHLAHEAPENELECVCLAPSLHPPGP